MPHATRPLRPLLVLASAVLLSCKPWFTNAQTADLPKLYFRDVDAFVRTEWVGTPTSLADIQAFQLAIRAYKTPGLYTRDVLGANNTVAHVYAYADPVLTVATTTTVDVPEAILTTEPMTSLTGTVSQVRVSRQPLFFLRQLRVRWQLEGVESPPDQVVDVQLGLRTQSLALPRIPMTHASAAIAKLRAAEPATFGLRGTLTVELTARDLDPLVADDQAELRISRTLPVVFATGLNLLAEALAGSSPSPLPSGGVGGGFALPAAAEGAVDASATPSASPALSPSPTSSATATP
ncbi:MAG: hypothetical protein VKQ33_05005 [Candidatus Sericytochromatia bacterium]|nr:hypothetical protein [Candidatus Sericytochromatia bacterium]